MAESLIGIATARGVVQISHEEAFEQLSILLAEDFLEQMEHQTSISTARRARAGAPHGCSSSRSTNS
jgi:hypothetical protein